MLCPAETRKDCVSHFRLPPAGSMDVTKVAHFVRAKDGEIIIGHRHGADGHGYAFSRAPQRLPCSALSSLATVVASARTLS